MMPIPIFISCLCCLVLKAVNRGLEFFSLLTGARIVCSLTFSNAVALAVYSFSAVVISIWASMTISKIAFSFSPEDGLSKDSLVCHWHQPCSPGSGSEGCFRCNKII